MTTSTWAQITPDTTLPNNSKVISAGPVDRLTEGTTQGNNLFHSFSQFSVLNGRTAFFDNALNIENIFTRVTGNSISNIEGIIRANGTANLFLLNPNGIIFSKNARLNIGGSFIGSTANSIKFSDGTQFSATNPQTQPLLSVNLPTALQFTSNPSPITVEDDGHIQQILPTGEVKNIRELNPPLQVRTGKTLALVGGNINLTGGNLKAESGRVELGSIQSPTNVTFDQNWNFDYSEVAAFANITLKSASSINTTGNSGGNVQLQGNQISFQDGSAILANTNGSGNAGNVNIKAMESLELSGYNPIPLTGSNPNPNFALPSGILSETSGSGGGGQITVDTNSLVLKDGAQLSSGSFNTGTAGDITVHSNYIELTGVSPFIKGLSSAFDSRANNSGDGGNITVNSNNLIMQNGAQINSTTKSTGNGGNIIVNSKNSVQLNQGRLVSSSQGAGNSGDITINTSNLNIIDKAEVNVSTFSDGKPGNIQIIADSFNIDNSQIITTANNKDGGDINLNISEISTLNNGIIAARSGNPSLENGGNGGNIDFKSQFIIGSGASRINADAFRGKGGNIALTAEGLFFTPDATITAKSGLNLDGTIEIKIPNTNPVEGLIERQNFEYPKQLAVGCNDQVGIAEGSLTYVGKGGIAPLSTDDFSGDSVLDDLRPVPTNKIDENIAVTIPPEKPAFKPIREAQGWRWKDDKKDTVILISNPVEINQQSSSSNPILCRDLKNHPS